MKANADKKHEWDKTYRDKHKEELAKKQKQYQEENKDEIAKKKKQYREDHKEQILKYTFDNKEKVAVRAATKVNCGCGKTHRLGDAIRHKQTVHHQSWEAISKD